MMLMSNLDVHRALVFAGIRRAAILARRHERESRIQVGTPVGFEHAQRADAIRGAIRIAIGSENQ